MLEAGKRVLLHDVERISALPRTPAEQVGRTPPPVAAARRLLLPSISDLLLLSTLAWLFLSGPDGWARLLVDGDTGWHIRTGEWILARGEVPRTDSFSFTRPGQPWFAWEWGADVLLGALHRAWGLKGVVLFSGLLVGLYAALLFRFTLWRGANGFFALGATLAAVAAASMHFLARPHLITLLLLPLALWALEADRRRPGRAVWLLAPLVAVWTNLHGGFLALLALCALLAAGSYVESVLDLTGREGKRAAALRYLALTALCAAASLANPYGWRLHFHVFQYLRSDWIRNVVLEFQSPRFRGEMMGQVEFLLLAGLVLTGLLLRRGQIVEALWLLFWAHQALGSVRHATIYVSLAAPLLACELTRLWTGWVAAAPRRSFRSILDSLAGSLAAASRWTSPWPALFAGWLLLDGQGIRWPADFPKELFPTALAAAHRQQLVAARLVTSDEWADYLLYRHYPDQRVFFDGRSDFYGPGVGDDYLRLMNGHSGWENILARYEVSAVLAPVNWPLASILRLHRGWRIAAEDKQSVLFVRAGGARPPRGDSGRP